MKILKLSFLVIVIISVFGCVKVKEFEEEQAILALEEGSLASLNVSTDFSFRTHKEISVRLNVPDFLTDAVFKIFTKSGDNDSIAVGRATFDSQGYFEHQFEVLSTTDSVIIYSDYVGFVKDVTLPIINDVVDFDYNESYQSSFFNTNKSKKNSFSFLSKVNNVAYTYLGAYNDKDGVPDYLASPDIITNAFLREVNASLPDNSDWKGQINPQILMDSDSQLILTEAAELWVTFVSEGTKKKNAIGYYSFSLDNPPTTSNEIASLNIIFPNASFVKSKGGLVSGDRVSLGFFPSNTVIGWFLVRDGFKGKEVKDDKEIYFSNPEFNDGNQSSIPNHAVVLFDEVRKLALFGFEDLEKKNETNDYNDVVFYAKSSPESALNINNVTMVVLPNDQDGDGIEDILDNYPQDATKAFNNYAPSATTSGKLLFEDLWPSKGDYDFNDLAVDYRYNLISNSDNLITTLEAKFLIENIGGSLQNAFAISLPINPALVSTVEGQIINGGFEEILTNGTEDGMAANETIVFVAGNVINMEGNEINLVINFNIPVNPLELGEIPFNPFLIVNGEREREVHLPDQSPTSKADYLNTFDDRSNPDIGRYYKANTNLPWALNIYDDSFIVPFEFIPITKQYPKFAKWANSSGTENLDWYKR